MLISNVGHFRSFFIMNIEGSFVYDHFDALNSTDTKYNTRYSITQLKETLIQLCQDDDNYDSIPITIIAVKR